MLPLNSVLINGDTGSLGEAYVTTVIESHPDIKLVASLKQSFLLSTTLMGALRPM
jgi:hypothetical protein